jgi:hypothetical protein
MSKNKATQTANAVKMEKLKLQKLKLQLTNQD